MTKVQRIHEAHGTCEDETLVGWMIGFHPVLKHLTCSYQKAKGWYDTKRFRYYARDLPDERDVRALELTLVHMKSQ